jgi:hypothetical protein
VLSEYALIVFEMFCCLVVEIFSEQVLACFHEMTYKITLPHKEAIRIVCHAGYRDHTNPLFKQIRILPLENLIKYSNLKFMHNYVHGKLPFSFNETWVTNRARNPNLELRIMLKICAFRSAPQLLDH